MRRTLTALLLLAAAPLTAPLTAPLAAQPPAGAPNAPSATEQDHRRMMAQLGITRLRPGPSGNESAPNAANYDESRANPYPDLPDVLTLKSGRKVTTPAMWWGERRAEIVEDLEREVYGRVPPNVPTDRSRKISAVSESWLRAWAGVFRAP